MIHRYNKQSDYTPPPCDVMPDPGPWTAEDDERERRIVNAPPAEPDPFRCPECGETYPAKGGCYGKPGQPHGWVVLEAV